MFYFLGNFDSANYADDSTPFSAKNNHKSVLDELELSSTILFKWFRLNYMKANTDKSHILLSGKNKQAANIDGHQIISEDEQVLLDVTIDSNLNFESHINNLCKKSSAKLNALARISGYILHNKT